MTDDSNNPGPPHDVVTAYWEAVQIIAESLQDFANLVCTPDEYRHNAKAILARLSHADITVEKVLHGTDEDNVDGITKYRAAQERFEQWEKTHPLADVAQTVQQLTDHQVAMLKAAKAATTQPVPGWPVVITAPTPGYFATMRRNHPMTLGEVIDGKRVVATHWHRSAEDGDQPVYRLEGEDEYRLASDLVGRIESISIGADITRPAAAETITQPPADGGEDVVKKLTDEDAKWRPYCKFQLVGGEWIGPAKLIYVACEDSPAPLYYNDYGDYFYGCRECTSEELAATGLTQPPRPTRNMFTKPIS
jgi:hypothetical protein